MSNDPTPATALAAAIRAIADQYRDLAIADELEHVAIRAEQYPDMPSTGRMQRALFDAEDVLLKNLERIRASIDDVHTAQLSQSVVIAELRAGFAQVEQIGGLLRQVQLDLDRLGIRDARQYADAAQVHAELRARLDRIDAAIVQCPCGQAARVRASAAEAGG